MADVHPAVVSVWVPHSAIAGSVWTLQTRLATHCGRVIVRYCRPAERDRTRVFARKQFPSARVARLTRGPPYGGLTARVPDEEPHDDQTEWHA